MTISDYLKHAELAQAAYTNLASGIIDGLGRKELQEEAGMSLTQAQTFATNWTVIDQYTDLSGVSATIFEDSDGNRHLAIRGTESLGDINADYILAWGFPSYLNPQFVQLRGQINTWLANGDLTSGFTVTGHSLGGYLAVAVGTWYSNVVDQTYTYNAPGLGGVVGNVFDEFRAAFGFSDTDLIPDTVNIRGSAGLSLISGLGAQLAPPVFIETEFSMNPINNHSIVTLTDALAVYNLIATIDPSVNVGVINGLFLASAAASRATLEAVVSGFGQLLVEGFVPRTGTHYDSDREALYADLKSITSALGEHSGMKIAPLSTTDADGNVTTLLPFEIENLARTDIAYRYALVNLNPFAVLGADYSSFNQNGELDLYEQTTGQGLTNMYLADRAEMLANLIHSNINDTTLIDGNVQYVDKQEDVTLKVISATKTVAFNGDEGGILEGVRTNAGNRLYGGSGNDVLRGYSGDDYLEGGAGNDVLDGGSGNDILNGGSGRDIYMFGSGHGHDSIRDFREDDGFQHGAIQYIDGSEIAIAAGNFTLDESTPNTWHSSLGHFTLTKDTGLWTMTTPGGTLNLGADFISGDFGIVLEEAVEVEGSVYSGNDPNGSYIVATEPGVIHGTEGDDMLIGNSAGGTIYGGGGSNWIYGNGGNSTIHGGDGGNLITGFGGGSTVYGGAGDDIIAANGGEYFYINSANALIGADAFWRDVHSLWAKGHTPLLMNAAGLLYAAWGGGAKIGTFSGESVLGDGWSYDFTITATGFHARYYHQVQTSEAGIAPAASWGRTTHPLQFTDSVYLYAGGGNNLLIGNAGDDYLFGGGGSDILFGGDGDDILVAGGGNNILAGGTGNDILFGDDGDDQLWGEDGDDTIFAGSGNNELMGGAGNDVLHGGAGDDHLWGEDGDDILYAGSGNNYLDGGAGNDILYGGDGDDILFGGDGNDILYAVAGNNVLDGGEGDDILYGGKGNDVLMGGGGNDTYIFRPGDGPLLDGVAESITDNEGENSVRFEDGINRSGVQVFRSGDDMIIGYGLGDWLYVYDGMKGAVQTFTFSAGETLDWLQFIGKNSFSEVEITTSEPGALLVGGASDDGLTATGGNSIFSGGLGNDLLIGAGGNNTYLYNLGDGTDRIVDSGGQLDGQGNPMPNRILFGSGITPNDITLALGSLVIKVGAESGNAIHIENFDPDDVFGQRSIDLFEFHDGSVLTYEQLMALGFDIEGTQGNDILHGTSVNDRLNGGAGDDILFGGDGNDILDGGSGNDFLDGGPGNDVYRFGRGYGEDTISHKYADYIAGKRDVIELGPDITTDDITLARDGDDLVLSINGTNDRLIVKSYLLNHPDSICYQVEEIRFAQGAVWDVIMVKEMIAAEVNTPPHVSGPVSLGDMNEDGSITITANQLLANAHDVDGDILSITNLSADSGTVADNGDGSWTYTPVADFNGAVEFAYEVSDGTESVPTSAALEVLPVNDAPEVSGPVSLGSIPAATTLLITSEQLLRLAHDVDGDMLSISNLSADSGTLIDNGNGTWSYRAASDSSGSVNFSYQVTDGIEEVNSSAGLTVEAMLNTIQGNNNHNLLLGTKADDLILGAGGNDTLLGRDGNDTLVGGTGNDILMGGRGDDTYIFNPGDGRDTIFDSDFSFLWNWSQQNSGEDTIRFGEGIGRDDVALFMRYGSLEIQYGDQDRITVLNQNHASGRIERIELANGSYLTDADINQVLQEMSAYAVTEGIALNSIDDVRQHHELMTMVAGSWQTAA